MPAQNQVHEWKLLIIHVFFNFINFFSFFLNLDNIIIKLVNVWGTMRKEAEVNQEPDFFFFFRATLGLYNSGKLTAQIDCHMT